jgi:transketolase
MTMKPRGAVIGIDRFGDSAPAGELFRHLGFAAEHVVIAVHETAGWHVERQR